MKIVNCTKDEYDVYIGRGSAWGNPYVIGRDGIRNEVIAKYRKYLLKNRDLLSRLHELDGKRLGCFCRPKNCHGDVLVELREKQTRGLLEDQG